MITAYLIGDRAVIARLSAMPDGLQRGVVRAVTRLALELQRLVQQKLSGSVLKVRTGVLRSSINYRVDKSATDVKAAVGTNVVYARYHEFGVPHSWEIRPRSARALAFDIAGALRRGGPHILSETVFAMRVIHPPLPERSFLRSALHEMTPRIQEGLASAVKEVTHGR